jgi:hypothetical protein
VRERGILWRKVIKSVRNQEEILEGSRLVDLNQFLPSKLGGGGILV